jgi:hypothetical protein
LAVSVVPVAELGEAARIAADKASGSLGPVLKDLAVSSAYLFSGVAPVGGTTTGAGTRSLAGATPHFKGLVGEERTVVDILDRGGVVIGEHVSFLGPTGQRTTIDRVWVDAEGVLRGTEAKFGEHADLTKPQSIVYPQGGHLALTPVGSVGSRAAEAGLAPGTPVGIHVEIAHWLF